jgi:hypothetical protein
MVSADPLHLTKWQQTVCISWEAGRQGGREAGIQPLSTSRPDPTSRHIKEIKTINKHHSNDYFTFSAASTYKSVYYLIRAMAHTCIVIRNLCEKTFVQNYG